MNLKRLNICFFIILTVTMTACGSKTTTPDPDPLINKNLNIQKLGTGNGTVTSDPVGIDCGTDCNQLYDPKTVVTLTATPAAGSVFSGWAGDADCSDGSVTVSSDLNCVASFDSDAPEPEVNLFFNSGSLSMVDPDNGSTAVVIESGRTLGERQLVDASFNTSRQKITGKYIRTVMYANEDDGKLYRISTLKSEPQPPVPVQVSNEAEADKICKIGVRFFGNDEMRVNAKSDYSDHMQSVYLYEMPGPDDNCSFSIDNEWKMVRLGMLVSEAPIPAKKVVSALYEQSTGGIIGFLAMDRLNLVRCDQDFVACSDVLLQTTRIPFPEVARNHFTGHIILSVGQKFYDYDVSDNTITLSYTFLSRPGFILSQQSDDNNLYFSDGAVLLKMPLDGSGLPMTLVTETDFINRIALTDNRVVYSTTAIGGGAGTYTLKAINKSGGSATLLAASAADSIQISLFGAAGNYVYYSESKFGGQGIAGAIKDDGTGKMEEVAASWVGPHSVISLKVGSLENKIIRRDNCVGVTCDLTSYDAKSNDGPVFLGRSDFSPTFVGFGSPFLGFDIVDPLVAKTDMFFVDLDRVDSLTRISTTPDINELNISITE